MQLLVAGTEQCQPTTATNFCYFSPPIFSIRKITIFFAHVLVVALNPPEAVIHSRSPKLRHHHHLSHKHCHKRPQQQITKRHTKHINHIISHSNTNCKSSKKRIMQPQSPLPEPMPLHCCPAGPQATCP